MSPWFSLALSKYKQLIKRCLTVRYVAKITSSSRRTDTCLTFLSENSEKTQDRNIFTISPKSHAPSLPCRTTNEETNNFLPRFIVQNNDSVIIKGIDRIKSIGRTPPRGEKERDKDSMLLCSRLQLAYLNVRVNLFLRFRYRDVPSTLFLSCFPPIYCSPLSILRCITKIVGNECMRSRKLILTRSL